jgi:transcriptional regulator of acetoin/glycerol metabolism
VAARQGRALRFSPDALRALLDYGWPGNVRELENALEYAVAVCKGQTILPEDLPSELQEEAPVAAASAETTEEARSHSPAEEQVLRALETHRWRRVEAARALGISRATLWRRMREAGLQRP